MFVYKTFEKRIKNKLRDIILVCFKKKTVTVNHFLIRKKIKVISFGMNVCSKRGITLLKCI